GNISSERAARNQSVYRSANEKLKPINAAVHQRGDPLGEWICECADASCELHVLATRLEYEQIRANPRAFIVYVSHVDAEVERVLVANDRYTIVEKFDNGGEVAEALD